MAEVRENKPETVPSESVAAGIVARYAARPTTDTRNGDPCLSAETIAAFVDGVVSPIEREVIDRHLAHCNACAEQVACCLAAAVGVSDQMAEHRRHRPMKALHISNVNAPILLAAAVLAAVGVSTMIWGLRVRDRAAEVDFQARLALANVKATRVAEIFNLSPYKRGGVTPDLAATPVERTRGVVPPQVLLAGRNAAIAAEQALDAVAATRWHMNDVDLARADLLAAQGRYDDALAIIDQVVARTSSSGLSVPLTAKATILLDRGRSGDEKTGLGLLDDVIKGMQDGRYHVNADAYYNRAMYDHAHDTVTVATRNTWDHYVAAESDPAWRHVAEQYRSETPEH